MNAIRSTSASAVLRSVLERPRFPLNAKDQQRLTRMATDALAKMAPGATITKVDITTPLNGSVGFYNWAKGTVDVKLKDGSVKKYDMNAGYRLDTLVPQHAKVGELRASWKTGSDHMLVDPVLGGFRDLERESARSELAINLQGSWREPLRGEDAFTNEHGVKFVAEADNVLTLNDAKLLIRQVSEGGKTTSWGKVELRNALANSVVNAEFKDSYSTAAEGTKAGTRAAALGKPQMTPAAHALILKALASK